MELRAQGASVYQFEGGEPYRPTPEYIKEAINSALIENETRYAPSSGVSELRRAIADKLRNRNRIDASEENVIVVNGGMQGLFGAFQSVVNPGLQTTPTALQQELVAFRNKLVDPNGSTIVDPMRLHEVQSQLRERAYQVLRLTLERFEVGRRFAAVRTRLVAADGRLRANVDRRVHGADARFRANAARLESLSPLAVLGRGYAVCWNADRTAIIRDEAAVTSGDKVHVKLERGELDCTVE